jgi:hydrogenase-4 component B
LAVVALRLVFYKDKTIGSGPEHGDADLPSQPLKCSIPAPPMPLRFLAFFRPAAPLQEDHPAIPDGFPVKTHYHSHVDDIAELHMARVVVSPVLWLFDRLRWIQHGDIHLYIGYILLAIVVLLFVRLNPLVAQKTRMVVTNEMIE